MGYIKYPFFKYIFVYMQTIKITTSQNIDIEYQLASLGDRVVARIMDYGVFLGIYLVTLIILAIAGVFSNSGGAASGLVIIVVVWLILCVLYDLLCEIFLNGQSVGKKAAKIKVISLNGARPGIGQYLLRWIFRVIDFGITFGSLALISVVVTDKKQRLGDIVAGTTVVNSVPKNSFIELVFGTPPENYEPVYSQVSQLTDQDIVLIHDVIRNFNRTRNNILVYKLAIKLRDYMQVSYPREINEYQFLEIVLNDYNTMIAKTA